jgi:hypothetical protein
MNDELDRIFKEAVVAYFKVLSQHLPGGAKENHEKTFKILDIPAEIRIRQKR